MKATYKFNLRRNHVVDWTPELDQHIVYCWGNGMSAGEIAKNLGIRDGRNCVLGRLNRLQKVGKPRKSGTRPPPYTREQLESYNPNRAAKLVDIFGALNVRENQVKKPNQTIQAEDC